MYLLQETQDSFPEHRKQDSNLGRFGRWWWCRGQAPEIAETSIKFTNTGETQALPEIQKILADHRRDDRKAERRPLPSQLGIHRKGN